eukprot:TRINITY_DN11620_c0_g1_i2.p2 TRINITY_DN11620_c0_g1~~TRINITY_DN11620_c0_g1_i2.p2  ORF type:complete len:120 (-),score=19.36 TRINITY_DN11620_c0_g1_i2:147-506(-)
MQGVVCGCILCQMIHFCYVLFFFFFNDTATTEIYTRSIVGSVRCVQETGILLIRKATIVALEKMAQNLADQIARRTRHFPKSTGRTINKAPHVLCVDTCLLYTSPSPRDLSTSRMPSSA